MEIQLILGPNNSGKSKYAEEIAVSTQKKLIYLATMVSQNEENEKRIEKHRLQRQGKGFQTIEADWNIDKIEVDKDTVVLLEDVSNLVANGIFMYGSNGNQTFEQIEALAEKCNKLIVVSISGLSKEGFDEETANYIDQLNLVNEKLKSVASEVSERNFQTEDNYTFFTNKKCEYFPCHKGIEEDNFNCMFCYCPLYILGDDCGGNFQYTKSGKKDCSACTFPHHRNNYELISKRDKEIMQAMRRTQEIKKD